MDKQKPKSIWDSKILWVFISILASILLWVYVTTTEGDLIEHTFSSVPVVFNGEENLRNNEGLVISNISTNKVSVRVRATRREISRLSSDSIVAVVDVSKFTLSGNYNQSVSIEFPLESDANSISIVSITPQDISFNIEQTSSKTIEVDGLFVGTVAEGYAAQPIEFNPQTVTVTGPLSEIDKVATAWVEVNREGVDKTIQFNSAYELRDSEGNTLSLNNITLETQTVSVTIPVTATKEVPLTVDLVDGGGASAENVKITCDPATITVAGDAQTLAGLNKISLGTVDLASFASSFEDTFRVVLDNDITNVTGISEAKVTIKIVGLETKAFNVSNITTINAPAGKTAAVITENVEVTLRGSEAVLGKIQANNIRIVADLAELGSTTGVFEPIVKVYVDGFTDVGAIGEYKVYVKLK